MTSVEERDGCYSLVFLFCSIYFNYNFLFISQELEDEEAGAKIECDSDFFEEPPPYDENASFYMMNLSRPLMKAIGTLNFVHPTPIQAATIPIALLGWYLKIITHSRIINRSRGVSGQNKRIAPLYFLHKCGKRRLKDK
jgi:hypothetical protein